MKKVINLTFSIILFLPSCSSYKIYDSNFEMKNGTKIKCKHGEITQAPTILYLNSEGLHVEMRYKNIKEANIKYQ